MSGRVTYLTTAEFHRLELACRVVARDLDTPYLVGSHSETKDFRDVDLRVILSDDEFDAIFAERPGLWSLLCYSVSEMLSARTGLPVDFQVQRRTEANEKHGGASTRNPMGIEARHFAGAGDATRFATDQEGEA